MKLSDAAIEVVTSLIAAGGGMRGDARRAIAYLPASTPMFRRVVGDIDPAKFSGPVVGAVAVETLTPHPDALSVGGFWINPTDELCPRVRVAIVIADSEGKPDIPHLCRDGGKLARIMQHVC